MLHTSGVVGSEDNNGVGLGLGGGPLTCTPGCGYDTSGCAIQGVPFGSDAGYNGIELPGVPLCDEISATGTATALGDDENLVVPIGFTFPVYGVDFTSANIQSNGGLVFGDPGGIGFNSECLPTALLPDTNVLYVFWDDLNPAAAGEIYDETLGAMGDQRFVVQWDVPNFGGDTMDLMRFQAALHESTGVFEVCYVDTLNGGNLADSGAEATAGIQQDPAGALQYSCNTPDLTDGLTLQYLPI